MSETGIERHWREEAECEAAEFRLKHPQEWAAIQAQIADNSSPFAKVLMSLLSQQGGRIGEKTP